MKEKVIMFTAKLVGMIVLEILMVPQLRAKDVRGSGL
jgi:hypothetical protein